MLRVSLHILMFELAFFKVKKLVNCNPDLKLAASVFCLTKFPSIFLTCLTTEFYVTEIIMRQHVQKH